jgi:hypothetical protein
MAGRRSTKRTRRSTANGAISPAPGAEWTDPDEFTAFWGKSAGEMALADERERAERGGTEEIISADEYFAARARGEEPRATVRLHSADEFLAFLAQLSETRADV